MDDAVFGILLLAIFAIAIVAMVLLERRERRKRRTDALVDGLNQACTPERMHARMRPPVDDDAPVWTNPDDFALAVAVHDLSELGFFADSVHVPIRERVAQLAHAYQARYGRPFRASHDFREPELAALDSRRVWWRDIEAEGGPREADYTEILTGWAKISREHLTPHNIHEHWETADGPVQLVIEAGDRSCTLVLPYLDDHLPVHTLLGLNALLQDAEFMHVHTGDHSTYVVCATVDEGVRLQDRGWPILGRTRVQLGV